MSERPYFQTSTQDLERLFEAAAAQNDIRVIRLLASELRYRDKPRAAQLKIQVQAFLKDHKQAEEPAPSPENAIRNHQSTARDPADALSPPPQSAASSSHSQADSRMTDPRIIERLKSLLEYVRQTAYLKGKPTRQVEKHGHFRAYEHELQALPGVQFDVTTSEDDVWLRVERLHESAPPQPSSILLAALIVQSNTPAKEPSLPTHVSRTKLDELNVQAPELLEAEDATRPIAFDSLAIKQQMEDELGGYISQVWNPWAEKEKEVRKTIARYAELFASYQMLQGNIVDAPLELVCGIGIAIWDLPDGRLAYPLISKLVELSIDEKTHAIEVRPRSLEPRLELDVYTALDNPGVAEVAKAGKEHFYRTEWQVSPFAPSTFEPVLKAASSLLDSKGGYWPSQTTPTDRQLPKPAEHLLVTDTWVLFVRPRTSSLFVQDLERFESLVESEVDLSELSPATWSILADPSAESSEPVHANYRGLSNIDRHAGTAEKAKDLFFPMPYNDEQVQIVHMLDHQDGVVVQGPPGTGKTHTIANVISHYLAMGKRVLVTSMKDPALTVLQEKLPPEIRPLAISLLSSEADGMKQFEHAIRHIAAEVSRISKLEMRAEVSKYEQQIDTLHVQIARTEFEIAQWAKKNLEPISLDAEILQPLELAKEVANHTNEASWIADELTIGQEHAPRFSELDVAALRAARMALSSDLISLDHRIPVIDAFPDAGKLRQAHVDLGRLAELNEQINSSELPPLRDLEQHTIEAAAAAHPRVASLGRIREYLEQTNYPWLSELERRMRLAGPADELLKLLTALKTEIAELLACRTQFLARPVALPEGSTNNPEILEAIGNLAQGRKPFGLAGLFGKSAERKIIDQIQVLGSAPATEHDWDHVLQYLRFHQRCLETMVRWNALAPELSLPSFDTPQVFVAQSPSYSEALDKLQHCLREEKSLIAILQPLFPSWQDVTKSPYTPERITRALEILDHNLTRNRLASTWQIKESFLKALEATTGDAAEAVRRFLTDRVGKAEVTEADLMAEWSVLTAELRRLHGLRPLFQQVRDITGLIEASGAEVWAGVLRSEPATSAHDQQLPSNWKQLWRLRRLLTLVHSMDGRAELMRLSLQRKELEEDLSRLYQRAITTRTWLKMAEKATPAVRSALEAYRVAISRIGKGTGIRAPRFRKDARDAAGMASPAIPCWIMPHYRISESLPVALGEFDLVIIDEASQSDLTALPALLRAKKVLIVGDDQQVSPEGVGLEQAKILSLMGQFLGNQVGLYRPQMSPEKSIYDLFRVVFAQGQIMLREHFRSVAPIIEYSKREFYDHQLQPLRIPQTSERLDPPLIDVHVVDGLRGDGKINEGEARFIVEEIRKITSDPTMAKRSIGVVSLVGGEQAKLVWDAVTRELGDEVVERHHMAFGDARTFQGKERDIMFLSMVVSGRAQASSLEMYRQRYNVAASRARDRMYLVRSISLEELSPADRLRASLIKHFQAPYTHSEEEVAELRQLCESPFEREVFDALVERGYRVQPQVKVGSYRIDLVVEGDKDARLAVECDGDRYHGPDQWEQDMRRQRVLERAGWQFWRCFASNFVLHRDAMIADLVASLQRSGIEPLAAQETVRSVHSQGITYEAFPIERIEEVADSAEPA